MLNVTRICVAALVATCWVLPAAGVEPVTALQQQLDEIGRTDSGTALLLEQLRSVRGEAGTASETLAPMDALTAELASVAAPSVDLGLVRAELVFAADEVKPEEAANVIAEPLVEGAAPAAPEAEPAAPEAPVEAPVEPEAPIPPAPREAPVATPAEMGAANAEIATQLRALDKAAVATEAAMVPGGTENKPAPKKFEGDPLDQIVSFDCEDMPLTKLVPILAYQAGINVIAGADLTGSVTMNLKNVTLRQAIETALFMNGLGLREEQGIFHIVPYEDAMSADRTTIMIPLENAKADEVSKVIQDILKGSADEPFITVSPNKTANVVVISGQQEKIEPFAAVIKELDVAEPQLETVTELIKLNYSEPGDVLKIVEKMISKDVGKVAADERARYIIVTDLPMVVEQIRKIITDMDNPVKQVVIDTMVVDVTLTDEADTGVDWLMESVQKQSYRDSIEQPGGRNQGNLQEAGLDATMKVADTAAGLLNFAVLSEDFNWRGIIQAEVRNRNGHLVSNPVMLTVENIPAKITISQEIPYVELTQTSAGGSQTSTQFKDIGTVFTVTPRVTHDNHIIVDLIGKESGTNGEFNGIPIEDKRELETTLMIGDGQTIFVGGLRKHDNDMTVKKIPILGDVPVMNMLFRSNQREEKVNELMVFLTCTVLGDDLPDMTHYQKNAFDDGKGKDVKTDALGAVWESSKHPEQMKDPMAKWRRAE